MYLYLKKEIITRFMNNIQERQVMSMSNNPAWAERESARYFNISRVIQEMNQETQKSQEELIKEIELYEESK